MYLLKFLSDYFSDTVIGIEWVPNRFINLTVLEYEALVDLESSSALTRTFKSDSLNKFWIGVIRSEYSEVTKKLIFAAFCQTFQLLSIQKINLSRELMLSQICAYCRI